MVTGDMQRDIERQMDRQMNGSQARFNYIIIIIIIIIGIQLRSSTFEHAYEYRNMLQGKLRSINLNQYRHTSKKS